MGMFDYLDCRYPLPVAAYQDYIDANGHNLNEPRIYVASAYRNDEFIAVREMLKNRHQRASRDRRSGEEQGKQRV